MIGFVDSARQEFSTGGHILVASGCFSEIEADRNRSVESLGVVRVDSGTSASRAESACAPRLSIMAVDISTRTAIRIERTDLRR